MVLWCVTLTSGTMMLLSLLLHHAQSCHGPNDASTSQMNGGRIVRLRNNYYTESSQVTSG